MLAYLLTPKEYGYIAILTIIISFAEKIANMGFSHAIIQKEKVSKKDLNSIFWFITTFSVMISIIIYIFSYNIATLFGEPELVKLIKYSSLIFLLQPIGSIFNSILKKELQYDLFTKVQIAQLVTNKGSMLYLAFIGLGTASFPIGYILGNLIANLLLIVIFIRGNIWFPKIQFSLNNLSKYFKFGFSVSLNSILNNLSYYIDEIIISSIFSIETLGIYHFVKNIFNNVIRIVDSTISQVMFPVFSKMQSFDKEFTNSILKLLKSVSLLIVPVSIGLSLTSSLFVPVLFGSEWLNAITMFYYMCFWAISHLTTSILVGPLYGRGRSDWVLLVTVVEIPVRILVLYLFSYMGINYFILAFSILPLFKLIIYLNMIKKLTGIDLVYTILSLKGIYLAAIFSSSIGLLIKLSLQNIIGLIFTLLIVILFVAIIYILLIRYLDRSMFNYTITLMKKVFNSEKKIETQ
ncbi:oligosaccharide flippase family protein [Alkalihalobacillus hwajinpoensis]|nr:oligosaccharide flippase family protein [Pseudalkalibacillus hwajinpoensis]